MSKRQTRLSERQDNLSERQKYLSGGNGYDLERAGNERGDGVDRAGVAVLCDQVGGALKQVGIPDDLIDASPFELSGGQKRRVAIAGVLAMEPEVLILDEPTAGLDPKGRDEILDQIARIHNERHITVILVSHSMEDVAKYVGRIIVMDHGMAVYDGAPKEVFSHYKELEQIGLAAPQVTYAMHALRERGIPVTTEATTVMEAGAAILAVWKEIK